LLFLEIKIKTSLIFHNAREAITDLTLTIATKITTKVATINKVNATTTTTIIIFSIM